MMFEPFSKTKEEYEEQIWFVYDKLTKELKFTGDYTLRWLQTTNPLLGDVSPMNMVKIGRFKELVEFIDHQIDFNKAKGYLNEIHPSPD